MICNYRRKLVEMCCKYKSIKLWAKNIKNVGNSGHTQKSPQHARACAARDGAICSENRKIVPYHKNSPNTRRALTVSSLIMAPDSILKPSFNYPYNENDLKLSARSSHVDWQPRATFLLTPLTIHQSFIIFFDIQSFIRPVIHPSVFKSFT